MKWLIFLMLIASQAYSAEVSLYAINSPHPLNWSSPRTLLTSTLRSSINSTRQGRSNHTIGHAYLGFKCDGEREIVSGITSGKGFTAKTNLFKNGHGLSVILQDNPGHFQDSNESLKDIEFYSKSKNRMVVLKMNISNDKCLKAKEWYNEYSSRTDHIYGGVGRRPLNGEGSGCTAYVMSYFEYANIDYSFFNSLFEQTIYMPNSLLGGEFGPNDVKLGEISSNRQRLDLKLEDTLEVKLYDPNRMYYWILTNINAIKKNIKTPDLSQYKAKIGAINDSGILFLEDKL